MTNFEVEGFSVIERAGQGQFGVTWVAMEEGSGRKCIIKEFSFVGGIDVRQLEAIEKEAMLLSHLDHKGIPEFVRFISEESRVLLIYRFVEGTDLVKRVQSGKMFVENEVLDIALQLADILEYLGGFSPPVIHRDIKPANIIMDDKGRVKLIDFGAVRNRLMNDKQTIGGSESVTGTFGYMAFEQFCGRALPQSDIYSLGVTLIFLLSLTDPTELRSVDGTLDFSGRVSISRNLQRVLEKMTAHDWKNRYPSAGELKEDLTAIKRGAMPPHCRRKHRFSAMSLFLCLVSCGLFVFLFLQFGITGSPGTGKPGAGKPESRNDVVILEPAPSRPAVPAVLHPIRHRPVGSPDTNHSRNFRYIPYGSTRPEDQRFLSNHPPELELLAATATSGRTITFDLRLTDAESDQCQIAFQYSDDGGANWHPFVALEFNEEDVDRFSLKSNRQHQVTWKTYREYHRNCRNLLVRLTPSNIVTVQREICNIEGKAAETTVTVSNGVVGKTACHCDNRILVINADDDTRRTMVHTGIRTCIAGPVLAFDDRDQVYISDLQGRDIKQLTTSGVNRNPRLPYDGDLARLLYVSRTEAGQQGGPAGDIVMHRTQERISYQAGGLTDWHWWRGFGYSADGMEVVYEASNGTDRELWIVNVASRDVVQRFPCDSDVDTLNFARTVSAGNNLLIMEKRKNIYQLDRRTGKYTKLTRNGEPGSYDFHRLAHPFYSSDMKNLFFTTVAPDMEQKLFRIYTDVPDSPAIYVGPGVAMSFADGYQFPDDPEK